MSRKSEYVYQEGSGNQGVNALIVLETEQLTKQFPGVLALDNVDFKLEEGEIHGLVGENGAGKSTFIKIISGVLQPTSGKVVIQGKEVQPKSPRDVAHVVGVAHQETELVPFFTGIDNLFLGQEITSAGVWLSKSEMRKKALQFAQSYGLDVELDVPVRELGSGKQQMITILKVLFRDPLIVIFDEPTAALSVKESETLFRLMRELKSKGKSIIYISHIIPEVLSMTDRITVLRNGGHVATVNTHEVTEKDLIQLMIAKGVDEQYPKIPTEAGADILRAEDVSIHGSSFKDINFHICSGEIVGFAGLVGSGRTELAKAVFTGQKPDGGEIYLDGRCFRARNAGDAIRQGIVMIPENRRQEGVIDQMSVGENITIPLLRRFCRYGFIKETRVRSHASSVVSNLAIKISSLEQSVRTLSGGNQQKVSLGKWFGQEAKVWIFDEPTKGIDVETKSEIYTIMGNLAQAGAGVWFISSDLRELTAVSDRIYVIRNFKVAGEHHPPFDRETILANMLGEGGLE